MRTRLLRRLAGGRALALPLALMVMTASGVMVVGVIEFTSSSGRTATVAKGRMSAESLAEAGLANAFSVLNNPSNNPTTPTLLGCNAAGTTCTPVVTTYQGGTATWSGWLDTTGGTSKWRITSIGQVANPTGAAALNVKLTATVALVAGSGSPNASVWNYVYSTKPPGSGCEVELNGNNIVVSVPVYVTGDLCFNSNNAVIDERGESQNPPPQAIDVRVGGKAVFAANGTSIGVVSDKITSAAVGAASVWKVVVESTKYRVVFHVDVLHAVPARRATHRRGTRRGTSWTRRPPSRRSPPRPRTSRPTSTPRAPGRSTPARRRRTRPTCRRPPSTPTASRTATTAPST
jgi:Tfp pilus assembly protein PilX